MATAHQGCRPRRRSLPYRLGILMVAFQAMISWGCSEEKQPEPPIPQVLVRMQFPASPGPAMTSPRGGDPAAEDRPASGILEPVKAGLVEREIKGDHAAAVTGDMEKPLPREGVYRVRPGDTLAGIASKKEVYGNPLKWTCLYRLNREELRRFGEREGLPDGPLPEGMELTYATPGRTSQRGRRPGRPVWVVNVVSSKAQDQIVPVALQLLEGGYGAYIARAEVRGEGWMRLRVGFFRDKKQATEAAEELSRVIHSKGPWVAKADDEEIRGVSCN